MDDELKNQSEPEKREPEPNVDDKLTSDELLIVEIDDETEPEKTSTETKPGESLVVEIEDDDTVPKPPSPRTEHLDLTRVDLTQPVEQPRPVKLPPPVKQPPVQPGTFEEIHTKKTSASAVEEISYNSLFIMAAGGLIGGLFGWMLAEPYQRIINSGNLAISNIFEVGFYAALVGAIIGTCISCANALKMGTPLERIKDWALYGLGFGAVGGLVGGGLAQAIYGAVVVHYVPGWLAQVILRAVGWSIMGVAFGLGLAALQPVPLKMRNGVLGGAIGGFIGGIAFQLAVGGNESNAFIGRMFALCLMGLAIGTLIGLIEEVAKDAWLRIIDGPLAGKEFILYAERTVIGSSPKCDICLIKDPNVAPQHAEIINMRTEFVIKLCARNAVVTVNGRQVTEYNLIDGDAIVIGKSRLTFHEKPKER
jgi:hypothetical protein